MPLSFAKALRTAPWFCLALFAILSLVPGEARPHTGLPGQAEHFFAYLITGLLLGLQVGRSQHRIGLALGLCVYAGILEIFQIWIPGRNAALIDFAASSCGAWTGVILSVVCLHSIAMRSEKTD
jgi:VanZ family protein